MNYYTFSMLKMAFGGCDPHVFEQIGLSIYLVEKQFFFCKNGINN